MGEPAVADRDRTHVSFRLGVGASGMTSSRIPSLVHCVTFVGSALLAMSFQVPAQAVPTVRLTVQVVAAKDGPRTAALVEALRAAGMQIRLVDRETCAPELLRTADVVLVDWPATAAFGANVPLGPFERWDRPTILLGDAGERFAHAWGLPGASEMAAMPAEERGPEMQQLPKAAGGIDAATARSTWRQGNLFHVGGAEGDGVLPAEQIARLAPLIAHAARFVSDRPIVRRGAPHGAELPAAEQQRRQRIADACRTLGVVAKEPASLQALPSRLEGAERKTAAQLLVDLLPGSKDLDDTRATWQSWLRVHGDNLVWDAWSMTWRVDWLAYWRGVPTNACRGDARADGGERDPAAVALATKVVQHHGGRALADLATFSCWLGDVHYQWDRRRGYFRMESHAVIPAGARVTPWQVSVIDTAADEQVIWGGNGRLRVSARSAYRELVERVFLPTMLLDPGVSLVRRPADDGDGLQALGVRLAGRGMDPTGEHVLLVEPSTGAIVRTWRLTRGRALITVSMGAATGVGPLLLPCEQTEQHRNGQRAFVIAEAKWNPELPADLATATERLSQPRAK